MTELTLAERLYAWRRDEDTLFDTVNKVLNCNVGECLSPGFEWACLDTYWDDYDNSVEVILHPNQQWLTDEQALKILELGFGQIYTSKGEEMENVSHKYSAPGVIIPGQLSRWRGDARYARTGDEDNQWRAKYRALYEIKRHD